MKVKCADINVGIGLHESGDHILVFHNHRTGNFVRLPIGPQLAWKLAGWVAAPITVEMDVERL